MKKKLSIRIVQDDRVCFRKAPTTESHPGVRNFPNQKLQFIGGILVSKILQEIKLKAAVLQVGSLYP